MPRAIDDDDPAELAAGLCERFEGFRAGPYLCPAGIPTIGYGFTRYPDGRAVTLQDPPIIIEHARWLLRWLLRNRYLPVVRKLCPSLHEPGRIAAIADFTFNLGEARLAASTLRKKIQAGRFEDVPQELKKWVRGGGRVLPGLVKRRNAEAAYFE